MRTLEITKLNGLGTVNLNLDGNDIISIELRDRETILVQESRGKFKSVLSDNNPKHIIIHEDGYVKVLQGDTQGNSERLVIQFGTDRSGVEKEFTIYTINSDTVKYNNTWLVNTAVYKDGQLEFRY